MPDERIQIDLADPQDIRAKMPEIRRLWGEKLLELQNLTDQVELLGRLVGDQSSTGVAGRMPKPQGAPAKGRKGQNAPGQDRAVKALEHAGRPMGPTTLYKYMIAQGLDAPKDANALGSNLWSAWKAGRIMKASNGVYQPLDGSGETTIDRPLTDYGFAAEQGFPAPASIPPANNGGMAG